MGVKGGSGFIGFRVQGFSSLGFRVLRLGFGFRGLGVWGFGGLGV